MRSRLRHNVVTLHVGGTLAALAPAATYAIQHAGRLIGVEIALKATGSTSGATTVDVNKGGTSVFAAAASITQGSATKHLRKAPDVGVAGSPSGVALAVDDVITVDVDAVPGTASTDLTVYLHIIALDIP